MKNYLKISILSLILFSATAFTSTAGWYHNVGVSEIYLLDKNRALVKLSKASGENRCDINGSGDVFFSPSANPEWYSALLAAYMSGKNVSIYYSATCTGIWSGTSYANVGHVRLRSI